MPAKNQRQRKQTRGGVPRIAISLLLWGAVFLYLVVPGALLVVGRQPEIGGTLNDHAGLSVGAVLVTILVTQRYGRHGFILCLAVAYGCLKHAMDRENTCWQLTGTTNLTGKVAVVTGANSGLGLATAKALASMGAHVVLTCRSFDKCRAAVATVTAAGNGDTVATSKVLSLGLSLGSLESVYQLSRDLTSTYPTIHYLFNNAGSTPQHNLTDEGLEDAFGGMHLAHMALTLGGEGDLRGEVTRGDGTLLASLRAYGRAKLSNMLFAFEANRRFRARHVPIIVHAVHTGSVRTKTSSTDLAALFQGIPGLPYIVSNILVPLFWRRPEEGARTLLFAALSNDPRMESGGQYVDALCRPWLYVDHPKMKALRDANDMYATRLWNVSLQLIHASPAQEFVQMAP
eukprot:scaffold37593_cov56-Attheya_sp.AAC.5